MDGDSIHFQSKAHDWETPQAFFDKLNAEFGFTVDAAASPENAKCERFWTYRENGLAQDWRGEKVWLNAPYGRDIPRWVRKAATSGAEVVVMLVPARTDTRWWAVFWDYDRHCPIDGCEVRFLRKRIRFSGAEKDAPFPCAIVIFRK